MPAIAQAWSATTIDGLDATTPARRRSVAGRRCGAGTTVAAASSARRRAAPWRPPPSRCKPGPSRPTPRWPRATSWRRSPRAPKIRQALLPPKPNELLATTRNGRCCGSTQVVGLQRRVGLLHVQAGGSRPCCSASSEIAASTRRPRPACGRCGPWWSCTARCGRRRVHTARSSAASLLRRAGAVQVEVVHVVGLQAGAAASAARIAVGRAGAFGVRAAHVVAVAAFAGSRAARLRGASASRSQQRERGGLAERQAVALRVPRAADVAARQFERVKAVQRGQAQAVDAADHGGVDQARRRSSGPRRRTPWRSTSRRWRPPRPGPRRPERGAHVSARRE